MLTRPALLCVAFCSPSDTRLDHKMHAQSSFIPYHIILYTSCPVSHAQLQRVKFIIALHRQRPLNPSAPPLAAATPLRTSTRPRGICLRAPNCPAQATAFALAWYGY